jgi:glutathione S-transferase
LRHWPAAIVRLDVPAEYQALHAWHERMQARPSVQAWKRMVDETATSAVR